ncbi:hypothetical protein K9N50_10905, partial [bacterium]|nr:hypothetical protein [bacterium]
WIYFETNRNNMVLESELPNICTSTNLESHKIANPVNKTKHLQYIEYPLKNAGRIETMNDAAIPKNIISAYRNENTSYTPQKKKNVSQSSRQTYSFNDACKDKAERILSRFKLGRNELEIAEELGVERDSVAFALKLGNYRRMLK